MEYCHVCILNKIKHVSTYSSTQLTVCGLYIMLIISNRKLTKTLHIDSDLLYDIY